MGIYSTYGLCIRILLYNIIKEKNKASALFDNVRVYSEQRNVKPANLITSCIKSTMILGRGHTPRFPGRGSPRVLRKKGSLRRRPRMPPLPRFTPDNKQYSVLYTGRLMSCTVQVNTQKASVKGSKSASIRGFRLRGREGVFIFGGFGLGSLCPFLPGGFEKPTNGCSFCRIELGSSSLSCSM